MTDQPTPDSPWKHAGWSPDGAPLYVAPVGTPPPSRIEWPPEVTVTHVELHTDPPPPPPVLTALEELIDAPPITEPQVQGDVIILPWPPTTAAAWRGQEIDASAPLTTAGRPVTPDGSHTAATDTLDPPARWTERRKGNALGTLVVPPGAVARLAHEEHPDLLVGPGVYILQTQRRWQAPAAD